MKKRIRKTGEIVDVITYSNAYCSERFDTDSVSYIDSKGIEHPNERGLNLWWDFEDLEEVLSTDIDWERRRYEVAREVLAETVRLSHHGVYVGTCGEQAKIAVEYADALVAELKKGGTL